MLAKFVESKKEPAVVPQISLAEKLRQKADSVRQAQGETERPIVDADAEYLSRCIYTGSITPFKCDADIKTTDGKLHELKLSFEAGKCLITSQLFPSPSYIVEKIPEVKPNDFTVTVEEFYNIVRIIKVFDGTKVSVVDEVAKARNKTPTPTRRSYTSANRVIFAHFNNEKYPRGTLDGKIFYRDRTPLFMKAETSFSLEPDVIAELDKVGCETLHIHLRDDQKFDIPYAFFKEKAWLTDKIQNRWQHIFDMKKIEGYKPPIVK